MKTDNADSSVKNFSINNEKLENYKKLPDVYKEAFENKFKS